MTPMEQAGYIPEYEREGDDRPVLVNGIVALKAACAASHKSSIGGQAMCICGRVNGGSAACNAMRNLRQLLAAVGAIQKGYESDLELWKEML